jgi:probable O-glycosylation ligase (exosortase A-associated)
VKQTILMIALTFAGTVGVLFAGPFIAISIYYLFAVLRPQSLWMWALPRDINWSQYVAWAAVVGTMGRLMYSGTSESRGHRRFAFAHAAFILFCLWIVITYTTAQIPELAGFYVVEYFKIFVMFALSALVVTNLRQIWTLYLIATCSLIYISYELNFLYLTAGRLDIYHSGYGGLDNNGAGLMIAMGLPLVIYAWEAEHRWWRWVFAAAVPVLIHAVLMSYSRGAMVALVVAAPLLIVRSRRRRQFFLMSIAIALIVPVLAGKEIRDRFFSVGNYETDTTAQQRMDSWTAAFRIANDYPVFGVGTRNASSISYRYGADEEGRTIHSQYLEVLADNGYPGLLFYLLALGSTWQAILRARRALKKRSDPDALQLRSMLAGVEGALAVFCIGSSFLALEQFELPYLMALLGIQSWVLVRADATSEAGVPAVAAMPPAPSRRRLQEARP